VTLVPASRRRSRSRSPAGARYYDNQGLLGHPALDVWVGDSSWAGCRHLHRQLKADDDDACAWCVTISDLIAMAAVALCPRGSAALAAAR